MKIINLGILAHVDAGKTTLTESLLYTSGAIAELGSVDEGTTRTDTMNLERQRGITIQTAVTSFQWEDVKVNIIDTPGHMDFLAEVYRSLSVLDGAVLLVSAKDGIQAQTRILFHALQIMKIPTIFFINKIDQEGIDLPMVYREMKAKLSSEIIVKQKVGQHPHINVTDNRRFYRWTNDVAEYLEDMAGRERQAEVGTVAELLEEIESENLYQVLVTVDGRTLKIVLLKMQGYSTKEIAPLVHLTTGAIYARLDHLRKKLRKIL